jgi:NitT/TauT family transport system ATP-binding protein
MLTLQGVGKDFIRGRTRTKALEDITFTVGPRRFVTIVGPSGCGKSTLLNLIAGLDAPSRGTIRFHDQPVALGNRRIGYVTQQDNLFPWRTLRDNLLFPLEIGGMAGSEARVRAGRWIDKVGLSGFEDAYPHELSGGMRQRGNIARTLIYEPELIMMDEPFGPLDAQTRLQLQSELLKIWEETGVSVLFITHDLAEAVALSTDVLIMSKRPGRIEKVCAVDLKRPRDISRIHDDAQYRALYDTLWEALRDIVQDADGAVQKGGGA